MQHRRGCPDDTTEAEGGAAGPTDQRERLVLEYGWLAERCAARYAGRGEVRDDLVQVAYVGLINAAGRFDAGRGVAFEAFAVPTIKGELRRHFRDRTWGLAVPRRIKELRSELRDAIARLEQQLGRTPSDDEVAAELHLGPAALALTLRADRAYELDSLDALAARSGEPSGEDAVAADGDDSFNAATHRLDTLQAIGDLDHRERMIVYWRFFEDCTQVQIADRLGIGQAQVSRLLHHALERISRSLDAEPDEPVTSPGGGGRLPDRRSA